MRAIPTRGPAALLLCCAGIAPAAAQTATETTSSGTIYVQDYEYTGQRNDAYQTRITATVDGVGMLFDQTFFRDLYDPATQAGLAAAGATRGIASHGAPGVVVWDAPVLVESWEEIVDTFTEVYTVTLPTVTVVTVQTTDGDAPEAIVSYGDRGTCYDAGRTGSTNAPPYDGAFASCDYWEEMLVPAGTVNTNTHTSTIVETIEVTNTQFDYLNYAHYDLSGHVVLIGHVLPTVLSGAFDAGDGLHARLQAQRDDAPASLQRAGLGAEGALHAWAQNHRGQARTSGDGRGLGNVRDSGGGSAGLVYAPASGWRIGVALDRTQVDLDVRGAPEEGRLQLTQAAVHGGLDARAWFVLGSLAYGQGSARTTHGDAALGGVSRARIVLESWSASVEAGYRAGGRGLQVTPTLGLDWQRVRSDEFAEHGGIPLRGEAHSARRATAWTGIALAREWNFGEGRSATLLASARLRAIVTGRERVFPVAFVDTPDETLAVTGVPESAHRWEARIGANLRLSPRSLLQLGVEGWRGGDDRGQRAVLGLRLEF
jgi:outer membrane autotransporter protein